MKLASIELISEINPHPNADKLELAKVLGYTCIVEKGKYKAGDAVVLIQPDTVLPDEPWAEMFKKRSSRTKAIKLRNVWSFGIVMSLTTFFDDVKSVMDMTPGTEVSHLIGVTKYEAPQPQQLDAKGPLPYGLGKTDEERYQNILDLPFGEDVMVTLKMDGCLKGDTKVITEQGELTIAELVEYNMIGTHVATLDTNTGELEYQPILSTSAKDNDGKQWYEVELDDGRVIALTENHRVWLPELECYRRADELSVGDEVIVK
jgi:tRNA-binding EMAP/Myf-like protein